MNRSPSPRPLSILLTRTRVRSSTPCCCRICECISSACSESSWADPPMGRTTKYAATRLAATNTPSARRITARGLLGGQTLKLLSIAHRDVIAVIGIRLRRRRGGLHAVGTELGRALQMFQQIQYGPNLFGAHHHV